MNRLSQSAPSAALLATTPVRWAALVLLSAAGCGETEKTASRIDWSSVRSMTALYGAYQRQHNAAPPDEQAFREFLASSESNLQRAGLRVEDMFVSPRDGVPIQWVYGATPPIGPSGTACVGYEKTPIDGARLVLTSRGGFELMNEEQFQRVFSDQP